MANEASLDISRRQFIATGGLTVAAACFVPRSLIAQTGGLFGGAFTEAATAKVTVQNLRRIYGLSMITYALFSLFIVPYYGG